MSMAQSILKNRSVLEAALTDDLYCTYAKKFRTEQLTEEEMNISQMAEMLDGGDPDIEQKMPIYVRSNNRFAAVYRILNTEDFWQALQQ